MNKYVCPVLLLSIQMMLGASTYAQDNATSDKWLLEDVKKDTGEPAGIVEKATDYVDNAQRQATERFNNFMIQVDGFFGDSAVNHNRTENKSWARLRLDARRPADGELDLKPSLKLRAVLPQTERRFKLLFSTEEGDTGVAGDRVGSSQSSGGDGDQNASFAIRFFRTARSKANINLDLGVRQRDSDLQYFTRLNAGGSRDFGDYWTVGLSNSYYYYNKSGFEDKLSVTFRRAQFYREDIIFRSYTEFNWRNGRKGSYIGQTLGLYKQFGARRSLALETLLGYHTSLNDGNKDHYRGHEIRARWRHNIWRPWFYYEFWPSISWPATNDFSHSFGILLRMEMVIGQR